MESKRVVSWNIRHGGGDGERSARIREVLGRFDAEVLVITEFRANSGGERLKVYLSELGYYLSHPAIEPKLNTVLIASRSPIRAAGPLLGREDLARRLWRIDLEWLSLCGVYMPLGQEKQPFWQALVDVAVAADMPDLVIGDFNTGSNVLDRTTGSTPFDLAEYMERMASLGYIDVWRLRHGDQRDYSWYSNHGGGFRLDHAFYRRDPTTVRTCEFDHKPREASASDHSALVLKFEFADEVARR